MEIVVHIGNCKTYVALVILPENQLNNHMTMDLENKGNGEESRSEYTSINFMWHCLVTYILESFT